ncbi:hypothetical protein P154DRAFT_526169 [Amniculicola lignicola CBS 123094]|uniref:Uncharacterized protein n=1 Tax=Amniculicola lignicola CBS 123094 TaxID=1392246 RepID=A0A6A5W1S1_9PLEO|nr:hypothetical protein P154DRAFT_526169 [Amniculicola lignicola CBS 123094]
MLAPTLQEVENNLDKVGKDLWCYDSPDLAFDGMLQRLSQLQDQLKIQRTLHTTAELLRNQSLDKPLPKQQATRVKYILKFTFEHTTREDEKHIRLRKLDCNALKFCGLSYKIKDIIELPTAKFNFLVENVADFVHRRTLAQYLYRDDIDKAVYTKLDPEDDNLFKEFMKCSSSFRQWEH